MEIKVGEYVRTKNGLIGKVNKIELAGSGVRFGGEYLSETIIQFNDGKVYERRVKEKDIIKHSFNLIDLIEVGDYVNGNIVTDKYLFAGEKPVIEIERNDTNCKCLCEKDIKSILTHELYEANAYKVKGEWLWLLK